MGKKLWSLGIALMLASKEININIPAVAILGALLAVGGAILICFDK